MKVQGKLIIFAILFMSCSLYAQTKQQDLNPHTAQFVNVGAGLRLEVLDWGGTGQPLILLPGLGDTAHVFDKFALALIPTHHVYGITPRGFGRSSGPPPIAANYSADRLGDDVVAVIDALKLDRPILAGHSIAGELLSSVATRHPEKISALIYIDAGYPYALYDSVHGDLVLDAIALRNNLDRIHLGSLPRAPQQLNELLNETRRLEQELQQRKEDLSLVKPPNAISEPVSEALLDGQQKFTQIKLPALAIFNVPKSPAHLRTMESQIRAFERQVPQARIVRIANADHYVFETNKADVVRAMNDFIGGLPLGSK